MVETPHDQVFSHPYRVSGLSETAPTRFDLRPDADTLDAIARDLNIVSLRKLHFVGAIEWRDGDWHLDAQLGATVTQECVVSFDPVRTRVDIDVHRRFTKAMPQPTESEVEIPEDDDLEPLGSHIDPAAVALEALALEIPAFPRAKGVAEEPQTFAPPGTAPLTDDDVKPFAGLAALKAKLEKGE